MSGRCLNECRASAMRCSLPSSFVLDLSNVRPRFYENSRITEFGSSRRWKRSVITSEGVAGDTMKHGSSSLITRRISSADTPLAVCPTAAQQARALHMGEDEDFMEQLLDLN